MKRPRRCRLLLLFPSSSHQLLRPLHAPTCLLAITKESRKRLGTSFSFLQHQRHPGRALFSTICTPKELDELVQKSAGKQRGSVSYIKAWRHYLVQSVATIREALANQLPHPVHVGELERLAFALGVAADEGRTPSFADAGARSGYALDYFGRARLLADLWMDERNPSLPEFWSDLLLPGNRNGSSSLKLASLGGGPGFDFVAAALVSTFASPSVIGGCERRRQPKVDASILDYEEGWESLVTAMNHATQCVLQKQNLSTAWAGKCDITKPLAHDSNRAVIPLLNSTHIWTCQYCVAENAKELRASGYIFFRELLVAIPEGSVVFLTETTPRLWPEFVASIESATDIHIGFPYKKGHQLVLWKQKETSRSFNLSDYELLEEFRRMSQLHQRRSGSGWERQCRKIRGGDHYFL